MPNKNAVFSFLAVHISLWLYQCKKMPVLFKKTSEVILPTLPAPALEGSRSHFTFLVCYADCHLGFKLNSLVFSITCTENVFLKGQEGARLKFPQLPMGIVFLKKLNCRVLSWNISKNTDKEINLDYIIFQPCYSVSIQQQQNFMDKIFDELITVVHADFKKVSRN